MHVRKEDLPDPGENLEWTVRQRGDEVELRLRSRGLRRRTLASWRTTECHALTPDPETALHQVATQLLASVEPRHRHRLTAA